MVPEVNLDWFYILRGMSLPKCGILSTTGKVKGRICNLDI
jgi:hypothetical protein